MRSALKAGAGRATQERSKLLAGEFFGQGVDEAADFRGDALVERSGIGAGRVGACGVAAGICTGEDAAGAGVAVCGWRTLSERTVLGDAVAHRTPQPRGADGVDGFRRRFGSLGGRGGGVHAEQEQGSASGLDRLGHARILERPWARMKLPNLVTLRRFVTSV